MVVCFTSCDANRVFDLYKIVPEGSWNQKESIHFEFEISDTISKNNLFINLRNNHEYSFSNLYLISKLYFPNGKEVVDTLQYEMAGANGKFLGSGIFDVKENKLFYKENVRFPVSGIYRLNISQAMRKGAESNGIENLKGITDVGFRIEKKEVDE
jgi:gliding motility-associated lipoprotein GldH